MNMQINQKYELIFTDIKQLKKNYMPFIKGGGIFVVTPEVHAINEKINLQISFYDDPHMFEISGNVVWINPAFAQYGREQGIGVSFENDDGSILKTKIEKLLADSSEQDIKTATL